MKNRTVSITVAAPRDDVFQFLRKVENLPQWATEFCTAVEKRNGYWFAHTSQGEVRFEIAADADTGVLDMWVGPAPDQMSLFPVRVLSLGEETFVSFTFFQPPEMPDELYEMQYCSLLVEMWGLVTRFGGGDLHAPLLASAISNEVGNSV